MDQMDVDQTSSTSKRSANSPPPAPPFEKRPRTLSLEDETRVNNDMRNFSKEFNWNWQKWNDGPSMSFVLSQLHHKLQSIRTVDLIPETGISSLVQSLNSEELQIDLKKGFEDGDWTSAIERLRNPSPKSATDGSELSKEQLIDSETKNATLSSWKKEYTGSSADLMESILKEYMKSNDHYARYVAHIQSSGTGKSRIHDELAKRIFYIPMSLAANGSQAYPPPDLQVRHWFEIATDPSGSIKLETVQKKCHSFVYALMTRAKEELEFIANELKDALGDPKVTAEDRIRLLSSTFRNKLSEGGTFDKHGPHRIKFYEDVVNLATKYVRGILPATPSKNERSLRSPGAQFIFSEDPENPRAIATAAEEVIAILDPDKKCLQQPLVIICWDESHSLTDEIEGESWTRFSELRRALRTIKDAPIFSVFLSTAGKFHLFSPDIQFESSNRITTLVLHRFSPITEVGFDEFAVKVKPNGMSTLTQIASTHHMAHLGRALFATRYDCGDHHVKKSIIEFAQVKVLCRKVITGPLQTNETLACLAIRLGLEFKSTSWVDRKAERAQVERHMRLCLAATPGFHNMVTISPSEPLLAEAAFLTMNDHLSIDDAPTQLLYHINWSYLDPGNKGEVVAALLLLLARDKAISRPNRTKPFPLDNQSFQLEDDGATHGRIITVSEFLDALLPTENTRSVKDQKPSRYRRGHGEKKLEDAFANGYIWFNHFVKVNDFLMVNRQYLWCLISRGAAVICANNHEGIDLLIPILFGNHLEPKSVSAILIQVKNDLSYTHNVRTLLFDFMDPFKVHFLSKGDTPSFPIIRMVFALASKTATVTRPLIPTRRTTRLNSPDKYTAYDIWVAGATHESFGVISEAGASIYTHLLERSCKIFNGYDLFEKTATSVEQKRDRAIARRKMHPGTATNIEHLQNYIAEIPTLVDLDDNGDEDSEED